MTPKGKGERIFIVDDEPAVLDSVWHYLKLEGFAAEKCGSGKECLERLKTERADLILLDIMMPEMDGFEVLQKMKQDKNLEHIPVILLTAKTSEKDQLAGWQKGAAHYVTKPFDMDELVHAILLALDERRRQINQKIYEI